ncbi:hypothetical protein C8R47DRAFT_1218547 [Mycena vitilis]|nr:hypothetical protein C8R47DRAFT_1218547 [Mycena vitilis]
MHMDPNIATSTKRPRNEELEAPPGKRVRHSAERQRGTKRRLEDAGDVLVRPGTRRRVHSHHEAENHDYELLDPLDERVPSTPGDAATLAAPTQPAGEGDELKMKLASYLKRKRAQLLARREAVAEMMEQRSRGFA